MILPEFKFLVEKVGRRLTTDDGKHVYQDLVLLRPGYTDAFGEKRGKDDFLEVRAWNTTTEQLEGIARNDKVSAEIMLNGRKHIDHNDGKERYFINLGLRKIQKL